MASRYICGHLSMCCCAQGAGRPLLGHQATGWLAGTSAVHCQIALGILGYCKESTFLAVCTTGGKEECVPHCRFWCHSPGVGLGVGAGKCSGCSLASGEAANCLLISNGHATQQPEWEAAILQQ